VTGLYSTFDEYPEIQEQGIDALVPSAGQVIGAAAGQAFSDLPSVRFGRALSTGAVPVADPFSPQDFSYDPKSRPTYMDADVATKKYGIPGVLSFGQPIAEEDARDVYEHRRAELVRQDTISRNQNSILSGQVARGGISLLTGLLDPVNVAASFIPVLPEARVAAALAGASGFGERAAIRAGVGALSGAAGAVALEPLNALAMARDHEEWTPAAMLLDVLTGAAMGGILHPLAGALGDRIHGIPGLAPEEHEALTTGAIAAQVEGRPVDVAPALAVMDHARAEDVGSPARTEALARDTEQVAANTRAEPEPPPLEPEGPARPGAEEVNTEIANLERQIGEGHANLGPEDRNQMAALDEAKAVSQSRVSMIKEAAKCLLGGIAA
jgi:hypothetical protein